MAPFMGEFRRIDTDQDGILTEDQFVELYSNLCGAKCLPTCPETIDQFLDVVDPHSCDKIPLSDIVQLFSAQMPSLIFPQDSQTELQPQIGVNNDLGIYNGLADPAIMT